ncbi:MAG: PHP domain-containing protein [Anaerolineales bacterium]|nr:PHP domain-containing protein [Anaerolineales bacterium]
MKELVINLHIHTRYSDGHASHSEIAQAAIKAGLDAIIITDHNVLVNGMEKYVRSDNGQVLLLVGEEIHDPGRSPQKNHMLVFGANHELAPLAPNPQKLVDSVRQHGGLSFLAHIIDLAAPAVNEPDISWVDWDIQGFTGIELWNGFSEFKSLIKSKLHAVFYAFFPNFIARGPSPAALEIWDKLLVNGQHAVAVGGSDAHALPASMGPLKRTLFPYEYHFRTINTHVLLPHDLNDNLGEDRRMIFQALAHGHAFIGYDLPAPTRGFSFSAKGFTQTAQMGDTIPAKNGVTFQVRLPQPAECRLIKNGLPVKIWKKRQSCTFITAEPGIYRVEVYTQYYNQRRGWIFSNPIYVI